MGVRFRKSLKLGPLRFTLSKSGIGASVGVKGFRVTRTAAGRVRTTASLPGTGLSYVKESAIPRGGGPVRKSERGSGAELPRVHKSTSAVVCLAVGALSLIVAALNLCGVTVAGYQNAVGAGVWGAILLAAALLLKRRNDKERRAYARAVRRLRKEREAQEHEKADL